jgi:SAM-dependent methyltransferase
MEENRLSYDLLADDFSRTRARVWEEFKSLGEYFQDGDRVLDLGCGNGRFYNLAAQTGKEIQYFGVDNSEKLIVLARQKYPQGQFMVNDGLKLPFEDGYFNKILCLAVLHHLPGDELRREFLREVRRALAKDGLLILTVWFAWTRRQSWKFLIKYSWLKIIGRSKLDWGDFYQPWGKKGTRYFHNFTTKELRRLLTGAGFRIQSIGFLNRRSGERNIVVMAGK